MNPAGVTAMKAEGTAVMYVPFIMRQKQCEVSVIELQNCFCRIIM